MTVDGGAQPMSDHETLKALIRGEIDGPVPIPADLDPTRRPRDDDA